MTMYDQKPVLKNILVRIDPAAFRDANNAAHLDRTSLNKFCVAAIQEASARVLKLAEERIAQRAGPRDCFQLGGRS